MFHIFLANGSSFIFFYENLLKTDTPFPFFLYRLPVQSVCRSYQPAFSQICSWSQHPETSEEASLYLQSFVQKLGLIFFACILFPVISLMSLGIKRSLALLVLCHLDRADACYISYRKSRQSQGCSCFQECYQYRKLITVF